MSAHHFYESLSLTLPHARPYSSRCFPKRKWRAAMLRPLGKHMGDAMRHVVRGAVLLIIGIALCQEASAQVLGTIAGAAKDTSGAVLPGVTVEVTSPALIEKVRSTTTDSAGLYRIVNLPPGTYTVSFSLTGFNTTRRESVRVELGFTTTID